MTDYEHIDAAFRRLRIDIADLRDELLTTRREVVRLKQWAEGHERRGHWTPADLQEVMGEER
jgi:hypothetical protein